MNISYANVSHGHSSRSSIDYLKHPMLMGLLADSLWRVRSIKDCYLIKTDSVLESDFDTQDPVTDNDKLVIIGSSLLPF